MAGVLCVVAVVSDYEALAQRAVEAGIGEDRWPSYPERYSAKRYRFDSSCSWQTADEFCHDWRVVGAAIVLLRKEAFSFLLHSMPDGKAVMTISAPLDDDSYFDADKQAKWAAQIVDDNDAIAILTAALDALEGGDD